MAAVDTGLETTVDDFVRESGESPRGAGGTRSQDLRPPPGLSSPGDVPAQPRQPVETTAAGDFGWNEPDPSSPGRQASERRPTWRCLQCDSGAWVERERALWECVICGSTQFYDSTTPTRREAARGVWMYMPHQPSGDASTSTTSEATSSSTLPGPCFPTSPPSAHPAATAALRTASWRVGRVPG